MKIPRVLRRAIYSELNKYKAYGEDRHAAKLKALKEEKNINYYTKDKIYSVTTFNNYVTFSHRLVKYALSQDPNIKTLEDVKAYVVPWLNELNEKGRSAYTLSSYMAGINKLYQTEKEDWKGLKDWKRTTTEITKNRDNNYMAYNPENYKAELTFSRCFGLRDMELRNLKIKDVKITDKEFSVYVANGKGGKERTVKFYGSEEEKALILKDIEDKKNKGFVSLFPSFTKELKIHRERQKYADRVYNSLARDTSQLSREEVVKPYTRPGLVFDKKALEVVTRALGHNRIDVAYQHYLSL